MPTNQNNQATQTTANLGFEEKLWAAADKMRGHMDPAEYKHVTLGLIFLKYISDAFEDKHRELTAKIEEYYDPEDPDEYIAENIFWVPYNARWQRLKEAARSPEIGRVVDAAMTALEKEHKTLKGVLPKGYARPSLDKTKLGELVDLIGEVSLKTQGEQDVLGRVYEYFLAKFASQEGRGGGEFYTPASVVQLLVAMLEPYKGRVYDPCCGSGGMFVQSQKFVEDHQGRINDISIYGQESNFTTWCLCKMNLAIRGIDANIGPEHADTFHQPLHRDMRADYILANPPFNISDWGAERLSGDYRWQYGTPPNGNANFAWVQHMLHYLSPRGVAGFVLANGSMSSTTAGEGDIRKNLIEDEVVDCMVALPPQLFYATQIPVCLWFLAKDRSNGLCRYGDLRDRRGEILFIDARGLGYMADRTHRDLHPEKDIQYIADAYHAWRGEDLAQARGQGGAHPAFAEGYQDIPGFCRAVKKEEVAAHDYVLTPGRYVGAAKAADDGVPFEEKMDELGATLTAQLAKAADMDANIQQQLARLGL